MTCSENIAENAIPPVNQILESLCASLARLDHQAVLACCARLETAAPRWKESPIAATDAAHCLPSLKRALVLTRNASSLYSGWARTAALQGAGYTPTGEEPGPFRANSLALNG